MPMTVKDMGGGEGTFVAVRMWSARMDWPAYFVSLLDPATMAAVRARLIGEQPWFFHRTEARLLDAIRESELQPRRVPGASAPENTQSAAAFRQEVLCFTPIRNSVVMSVQKETPLVLLAIAGVDLPDRLSIDWTFPDAMRVARTLYEGGLVDPAALTAEVARRTGSIACYAGVSPSKIRLSPNGIAGDAAAWPLLRV